MRFLNILIILGCLVGGYWLVSSIMSPGIKPGPGAEPDDSPGERPGVAAGNRSADAMAAARAHERDWHLILDVPADANRREIEAAYKRRLAKADNAGDSFERIRVQRAYEAAQRYAKG